MMVRPTIHIDLKEGDALEIGDEYLRDGQWVRLTAEEFEQWASACSHYYPSEGMYPHRRPANKHREDIERTRQIFDNLRWA